MFVYIQNKIKEKGMFPARKVHPRVIVGSPKCSWNKIDTGLSSQRKE